MTETPPVLQHTISELPEIIESEPTASHSWLVTFTDLISLLLAFFVMLFSMSSIEIERFKDMVDSLSKSLNPDRQVELVSSKAEYNISAFFQKRAINLDYLTKVLERKLINDPILAKSHLSLLQDRLVLSLPGDLLFRPGSANLEESGRQAVFQLGGIMRSIINQLSLVGHTDPTPITGKTFTSNWELSLARAAAVANALKRAGYTEQPKINGVADSRFDSLPALPTEQRYTLARRVDVVIFPSGFKK